MTAERTTIGSVEGQSTFNFTELEESPVLLLRHFPLVAVKFELLLACLLLSLLFVCLALELQSLRNPLLKSTSNY
jgi:hypothetical protein